MSRITYKEDSIQIDLDDLEGHRLTVYKEGYKDGKYSHIVVELGKEGNYKIIDVSKEEMNKIIEFLKEK